MAIGFIIMTGTIKRENEIPESPKSFSNVFDQADRFSFVLSCLSKRGVRAEKK